MALGWESVWGDHARCRSKEMRIRTAGGAIAWSVRAMSCAKTVPVVRLGSLPQIGIDEEWESWAVGVDGVWEAGWDPSLTSLLASDSRAAAWSGVLGALLPEEPDDAVRRSLLDNVSRIRFHFTCMCVPWLR